MQNLYKLDSMQIIVKMGKMGGKNVIEANVWNPRKSIQQKFGKKTIEEDNVM